MLEADVLPLTFIPLYASRCLKKKLCIRPVYNWPGPRTFHGAPTTDKGGKQVLIRRGSRPGRALVGRAVYKLDGRLSRSQTLRRYARHRINLFRIGCGSSLCCTRRGQRLQYSGEPVLHSRRSACCVCSPYGSLGRRQSIIYRSTELSGQSCNRPPE